MSVHLRAFVAHVDERRSEAPGDLVRLQALAHNNCGRNSFRAWTWTWTWTDEVVVSLSPFQGECPGSIPGRSARLDWCSSSTADSQSAGTGSMPVSSASD